MRRDTHRGSAVPPLLALGLGIAVLVISSAIPAGNLPDDPGPAFLPRVAAIGLIGFGMFLLWHREPHESLPGGKALTRVVVTVLLILAYLMLIEPAGFVVATALFLAAEIWLIGIRRWPVLLVMPLVLSIGVYAMFRYGLEVPLPETQIGGATL